MRGWLLIAVALAGCDAAEPERPSRPPERAEARPTAKKVVQQPDWPTRIDARVAALLGDAARAEVARSPVPVLALADAALLPGAVVTTGPHWYALSAKRDGLAVSVRGTRLAHEYRDIPETRGAAHVRGHDAFVTQNEGIWSASWMENGIAYSIDMECHRRDDERCQDERELLRMADDLAYVGGEGSRK